MKGVIAMCMASMVIEKFGRNQWEETLQRPGLPKSAFFLAAQDIDDKLMLKLIDNACETLGITEAQAADAFGDYWVNEFTPKMYGLFFKGVSSAKDFLVKLDKIHVMATQTIPDARPPRFDYEWANDKTLVMTYKSERGLLAFFLGLLKGVGKHFNEKLEIRPLGNNRVEIVF